MIGKLVVLLLMSGAWAAPLKNDDQKKSKRHSVGVSSYNLPYSFAGYPFELFGYPFGSGARIFGGPLINSLVFAYPFGLEYGNPLYGINSGYDIGSNELALAAYSAGLVSDVGAFPSVSNPEHGKIIEVPSFQSTQPQSPTNPPTNNTIFAVSSIGLIDETEVSGGVESLKNKLQLS